MSRDRFVAIDVETANADLASVCQIGLVTFDCGTIASSWQSLVNPEDEFDAVNVSVHGIDQGAVQRAPRFTDVASQVNETLTDQIVASHTGFDRLALSRVCEKYDLPQFKCSWLDTARVVRRAWQQFSRRGYGLADVTSFCGIDFGHHDAEEDARAAGQVLLRAIADTGLGVREWLLRAQQPIDPYGPRHTREGNPDGELFGEEVVFTGALSLPRREIAQIAAEAGCRVSGSVGKKTTLLVVGDQDVRKLAGKSKSSKHLKAEGLILRGQRIRLLTESDFRLLISLGG